MSELLDKNNEHKKNEFLTSINNSIDRNKSHLRILQGTNTSNVTNVISTSNATNTTNTTGNLNNFLGRHEKEPIEQDGFVPNFCITNEDGSYGESSSKEVDISYAYEIEIILTPSSSLDEAINAIEFVIRDSVANAILAICKQQMQTRWLNSRRFRWNRFLFVQGITNIPSDELDKASACSTSIEGSECSLVDGGLSVYLNDDADAAEIVTTQEQILAIIQTNMEDGFYSSAFDGIVKLTFMGDGLRPVLPDQPQQIVTGSNNEVKSPNLSANYIYFSIAGILIVALISILGLRKIRRGKRGDADDSSGDDNDDNEEIGGAKLESGMQETREGVSDQIVTIQIRNQASQSSMLSSQSTLGRTQSQASLNEQPHPRPTPQKSKSQNTFLSTDSTVRRSNKTAKQGCNII